MSTSSQDIAKLFRTISQPARLEILMAIGSGEACVCHLEATLGYRQAYISQHLMALRKAKLLTTRRDGRYIFYQLRNPQLLDLVRAAGAIAGSANKDIRVFNQKAKPRNCDCPDCEPDIVSNPAHNQHEH